VPAFRITKKLAAALHVKLPKDPAAIETPEHDWFADLFYVERKKCMIWVHRTTLLGFVRPAVVAAELREFHALFRYEFRTALASMALTESLLDRFDVYGPESYAPTNDRAVVGSMLDYRKMFEAMVGYEGGFGNADIRAINAVLNDTPMSVLKMDSAVRTIRRQMAARDGLH
jgi:uncharacterized protein DUF6933